MKTKFILPLILFGICLLGMSPIKAQPGAAAATAIAVKSQTVKQTIWHGIMKRLQTLGNQYSKSSASSGVENLSLQKKWFTSLEQISNAVRNYRKVKAIISRQVLIMNMYKEAFERFRKDRNFSVPELRAIAQSYSILIKESTGTLSDLKMILKPNVMKMTDSERLESIDRLDEEMKNHYALTRYFTQKTMAVSYVRSDEQAEMEAVKLLYGIE